MRSLLYLLFLFFLPLLSIAQSTTLSPDFANSVVNLSVTKDENLILATRGTLVGIANSITSDWRQSRVRVDQDFFNTSVFYANFFNKDTGFLSGYNGGKKFQHNLIYHTTDGGATWRTIDFGQDGWIDDALNLDNGEAWLSVGGSGIAYTKDHGFTWENLKFPGIKQRFNSIFFNSNRHGIIGSGSNYLAYTEDNCETWKILLTPLDQNKYIKSNQSGRSAINRVAILNDMILVKQEELVFYSKKDTIDWIWLKDYDDFYTDPGNSALFFRTTKGILIRADKSLVPIYTYTNAIPGYYYKCKNGSLFIAGRSQIQQLSPNNQVTSVPFTNPSAQRVYIGSTTSGPITMLNNKAYKADLTGIWNFLFEFPVPVNNGRLSMIDTNQIIYQTKNDSMFYFDLSGKLVNKTSKETIIEEFYRAGIKKLIFSSGAFGCHYGYADKLIYNYKDGNFGNKLEQTLGSWHNKALPGNSKEIDGKTVSDFVSRMALLFDTANFASIDDLGFTAKEYDQCKKDILDFKASLKEGKTDTRTKFYFDKNNIDFETLLNLVDTIKSLDKQRLNQFLFDLYDMKSTTTDWKELQLVNNKDEILSIVSRYYIPTAFYFPWTIKLNGYSINTTNIEINRFLDKVYPSFLPSKDRRVEILHVLVKKLY